ncbi:DUF3048 domain-containing protein [Flexivirga sp.]|uniref:DUF3048 domain-containing protein n=1 Tax=Flexivirga sp. TaxID=1962927 RepID=UPI003F81D36B
MARTDRSARQGGHCRGCSVVPMTAHTRRGALLATAVGLLSLTTAACGGGSTASTASRTPSNGAPSSASPTTRSATPRPTTGRPAGNPLTGGPRTGRPVIAVKVENTSAAVPQYGLSPADLVFVEEVEGNLTRLMPVYSTSFPSRVEPVRSARSTDVEILPMFGHPALVYSGAASQIRAKLDQAPITLLGGGRRDSHRRAPHNLYVDVAALAQRHGLSASRDIGLRFAEGDPRLQHAAGDSSFTVQVGGDRFSFSYQGSHYLPSWNGRPYRDVGAGGHQVTADNVLVLRVREVSDGYRDPAGNPVYRSESTGSGKLTLFRNGKKLSGTWHRAAVDKPFRLTDDRGRTLTLTPGKTWILLQNM